MSSGNEAEQQVLGAMGTHARLLRGMQMTASTRSATLDTHHQGDLRLLLVRSFYLVLGSVMNC